MRLKIYPVEVNGVADPMELSLSSTPSLTFGPMFRPVAIAGNVDFVL